MTLTMPGDWFDLLDEIAIAEDRSRHSVVKRMVEAALKKSNAGARQWSTRKPTKQGAIHGR